MPFSKSKFTGFPFDRDLNRDEAFRSQLDDLAKRHPELAGHFEGFPFRSNSWDRRHPESPETSSRFGARDRPFGSRFEEFGFPFRDEPFHREFPQPDSHHQQGEPHQKQYQQQTFSEPQQNQPPPPPQSVPKQSQESASSSEENSQRPPQAPERGRKPNHIYQSNTVDLGQKQEPVNERNQRSMSAPPPGNRFVSSINIPIHRDASPCKDKGPTHTQPSPQQQSQPSASKPTERVIPIHVEGRDEPVMPKNIHHTFTQPPQHHTFQQPEPETIFGGRPNLSNFAGRNAGHFPSREDVFKRHESPHEQRFQQTPPKAQEPPRQQYNVPPQQHTPPPQHQQQTVPPQQQEQEPQQPTQNQQHPTKLTPIDLIKAVQKDVSELMGQVEQFNGIPRDKQYLYLDEMLTRNLIKLDNIDTQGQENIRSARREAVKCIEKSISILESKANANLAAQNQAKMEVDVKPQEQTEGATQSLNAEQVIETDNTQVKISEDKKEQAGTEAMEVVPPDQSQNVDKGDTVVKEGNKCEPVTTQNQSDTQNQNAESVINKVAENTPNNQSGEVGKMEVEEKPGEVKTENQSEQKPPTNEEKPSESSQPSEAEAKDDKKEKKKGKKKEKSEKK